MKKLFALFTLVAAVVAITSCSGGPKIKGTPIEKAHFTILQPEGWEVVTNEDANVEIKHQGEKFTNFIIIKEDTEAYDKAMEYYLSPDGGYKQVEEKNMFNYVEHHTPAIMEELGIPMYFSKGSHSNIKITEKEDVDMFLGYQLSKKYNEEHKES